MASNSSKNIGIAIIRFALACFFIVNGLCILGLGASGVEGEIRIAVSSIFKADAAKVIVIVLGVIILLCGVFLFLEFFIREGVFSTLITVITLVLWLCVTVIVDFLAKRTGILNHMTISWITWLLDLSKNLLVIGGLIAVKD